jgi:hypothetical protein
MEEPERKVPEMAMVAEVSPLGFPFFFFTFLTRRSITPAAAFLEFHEPLAAFLPENASTIRNGFDTLIGPGEIYNNWVRADVLCKSIAEEDV